VSAFLFFHPPPLPQQESTNPIGYYSQRAFRERKERHVRDLEAKLTHLESSTHSLQSDNDRLKLALQRARTENEILRATTGPSPTHSRPGSMIYPEPGAHLPPENLDDDEPYNVQSLSNGSLVNAADKDHTAMRRKAKGKDVPAAKMWDVIQSHPLIQRGLVDVADVCERLRGVAKCDGAGPVFDETIIYAAIESARRSGGDTLI
jgi:AP-1-like factor